MAETARRRLSAEERRQSILAAANQVFGEHGYEHVRIDDIATALTAIEAELRDAGVDVEVGRAAPAALEAFGSVPA